MPMKVNLIIVSALTITVLSSCIKGYDCKCEANDNGSYYSFSEEILGTKADAKLRCDEIKAEIENGHTGLVNCTVK